MVRKIVFRDFKVFNIYGILDLDIENETLTHSDWVKGEVGMEREEEVATSNLNNALEKIKSQEHIKNNKDFYRNTVESMGKFNVLMLMHQGEGNISLKVVSLYDLPVAVRMAVI